MSISYYLNKINSHFVFFIFEILNELYFQNNNTNELPLYMEMI